MHGRQAVISLRPDNSRVDCSLGPSLGPRLGRLSVLLMRKTQRVCALVRMRVRHNLVCARWTVPLYEVNIPRFCESMYAVTNGQSGRLSPRKH